MNQDIATQWIELGVKVVDSTLVQFEIAGYTLE